MTISNQGGGGGAAREPSNTVTIIMNGEQLTFEVPEGKELVISHPMGCKIRALISAINQKPINSGKVNLPIDEQEARLNMLIQVTKFEPLTERNVFMFNQLLGKLEIYNQEMDKCKQEQNSITKAFSYLYASAVTSPQAAINASVDKLKEKFIEKSLERINQLIGQGASNVAMTAVDRQAAKEEIVAIVKTLEKIGANKDSDSVLDAAEDLFGLVGLTKSSRDKIALVSEEELQRRITSSNELLEYAISKEEGSLPEGFFRISGDADEVKAGMIAYEKDGLAGLDAYIKAQESEPEVLRNIVKSILRKNFSRITLIDPDRFPLYFSTILKIVAQGDSATLQLKGVYNGLPLAKESCLEIEEELKDFASQLESLENETYNEYKLALGLPQGTQLREGDLIKLIFYPDMQEPRINKEFHAQIIALIEGDEKYIHLNKMLKIIHH